MNFLDLGRQSLFNQYQVRVAIGHVTASIRRSRYGGIYDRRLSQLCVGTPIGIRSKPYQMGYQKMKKDDIKAGENKTSTSRRRLLTALTAGGAAAITAPSEWTKPALKAVMLPAHAQTSPGAGGDCTYRGIHAWGLAASFCMSVSVHADADCGSSATVEVRNGSGALLVMCTRPTSGPFGNDLVSWSCCGNTITNVQNGELVTFDVEFSNGCSCRQVVTAL